MIAEFSDILYLGILVRMLFVIFLIVTFCRYLLVPNVFVGSAVYLSR